MASLEFDEVSKIYDKGAWAVRDLSLNIRDGEFVVLVGPSGCGKTTALRMLAGFEEITAGEIRIGDKPVNDMPARDRDIAMVFQNYALYPHMNVYDNIAYGLKVRKVPKAERVQRIHKAAEILGLTAELKRKPSQLSGGQRQRVAMGRAIVREPRAFLMDEPLSNLDARLRVRMRTEIATLQRDLGVTTVYVTHDQVEAMTMADRVAVMRSGVLQQFDTAQNVYSNPANLFVASFIGSPGMNLVNGLIEDVHGLRCRVGSWSFALPDQLIQANPALANRAGGTVIVGIRPETISITSASDVGLRGSVAVVEELGSEVIVHVVVDVPSVQHDAINDGTSDIKPDGLGGRDMAPDNATSLVARLPADTPVDRGQTVAFAADVMKMHFFNPNDGASLRHAPDPL